MCIDWGQLDTRNCHQNADLQKVEQVAEKSAWSGQYGLVDAVTPAVLNGRQALQLRRGVRPGPLSRLGSFHLTVHWYIKQHYAMLKDVKKTGLHFQPNSLFRAHKQNVPQTHLDHTRAAPPSNCLPWGQSFYKKGPRSRFSLVRPASPLALRSLGYPSPPEDIPLLNSTSKD